MALQKIRQILKSYLNGKNKIHVMHMYLQYCELAKGESGTCQRED